MLEKRFIAVSPQPFTANGTTDGKVTVADTRLFKVKQKVFLKSNALQPRDGLEVKRIISRTEMHVGPEKQNITSYSDLSDFLVADVAVIGSNEQHRPSIPLEEFSRAVYEEEPTVAIRSMLVDKEGNDYRTENPLPVQLSDGDINIGSVNAELEVQLSHLDNDPDAGDIHDSVRIGDGVEEMQVNPDGSINVNIVETTGNGETILNIYGEVENLVSGVETVLASFTAGAGKTFKLQRAQFSGEQIARYKLYVNNIPIATSRTHHGSGLSGNMEFVGASQEGLPIVNGDIVELRALHSRPGTGDFEGRIQIYEAAFVSVPVNLLTELDEILITESGDNIILE